VVSPRPPASSFCPFLKHVKVFANGEPLYLWVSFCVGVFKGWLGVVFDGFDAGFDGAGSHESEKGWCCGAFDFSSEKEGGLNKR